MKRGKRYVDGAKKVDRTVQYESADAISRHAQMEEFMFLGLRMLRGVSDVDFIRLFGVKMETVYGDVIARLISNGLLK